MPVICRQIYFKLRLFVTFFCVLHTILINVTNINVVVYGASDDTSSTTSATVVAEEIRPDEYISEEHWNYSNHLNENNFNQFINDNIQSGKTIFVRWTAGLYCGSCAKQSQAWDDAIRLFTKNPNILFGDVDIKEIGITNLKLSPHNPGYDGWPTIRYFNSETGIEGKDYIQQTKLRKWEELGPDHMFLIEFIEDKSNNPLCDVKTLRNCDDKSKNYIKDMNDGKSSNELQKLLESVHVMEHDIRKSGTKKRDLWLIRQKHILMQLVSSHLFVQWD